MTAPSAKKPFNIAICGGGIAGLCLAIGLLRHNVPFHIYESAPAFGEIGAGVSFGLNVFRVMSLLDPKIKAGFEKHATRNSSEEKENTFLTYVMGMDGRAGRAGERIHELKGEGVGMSSIHRASFLDELVALIPRETASFGKKVVDVVQTEEGVTLMFADGDKVDASAAVGCDGIRSRVRAILLGEENKATNPTFAGKYAYRGLVPMDKAVSLLGDELARNSTLYLGYSGNLITFPIAKGKTMNVVAFRTKKEAYWDDPRWVIPMERKKMEEDFEGWGDSVMSILTMMEKPDVWAFFDYPPADTYYKGRLCIMGDAAHASTPYQGAGAGMAVEDAFILSRLLGSLQQSSEIEPAFHAFDVVRRPRTQRIVTTSRACGDLNLFEAEGVGDDLVAFRANVDSRYWWIWDIDLEAHLAEAMKVLES